MDHVAEDHVADLAGIDLGPRDRFARNLGCELGRRNVFQRAAVIADCVRTPLTTTTSLLICFSLNVRGAAPACADNNARRQCYAYCFTSTRRAIAGDRRAPGENSHFRQRPVIFGGYLVAPGRPVRLSGAGTNIQEDVIMTDGEMEVWTAGQDWTGWPTT